jgi:hypothetical protein
MNLKCQFDTIYINVALILISNKLTSNSLTIIICLTIIIHDDNDGETN